LPLDDPRLDDPRDWSAVLAPQSDRRLERKPACLLTTEPRILLPWKPAAGFLGPCLAVVSDADLVPEALALAFRIVRPARRGPYVISDASSPDVTQPSTLPR
jgi:hypothetical protein